MRRAVLVGTTGREMTGLAQVLAQGGLDVVGQPGASDARRGYRVDPGHAPAGSPILIHGPGVSRLHPDRLAAASRGFERRSRGSVLAELAAGKAAVAVWGGRSAERAAAMIGWTLSLAGLDPTVVLEAGVPQLGGAGRLGRGGHCVFQASGQAEELAEIRPHLAIALGDAGTGEGPGGLLASVPAGGLVLGRGVDPGFDAASRGLAAEAESIALDRGATWWGADLREDGGRFRFRAFRQDRFVAEVRLRVRGLNYVEGALVAVAACHRLALPPATIKEGLEEFTGVSRGFESRGSGRGVTLWDDDARDPGSVAEAVGLARRLSGRRRLWAAASAGVLGNDPVAAARALGEADRALVVLGDDGPGPGGLDGALEAAGRPAALRVPDLAAAVAELDGLLEPGDVLLTLGAVDVGTIADALSGRLPRDRQDD